MLVKKHSVEELAERIKRRSVISKQRVITESTFFAALSFPPNANPPFLSGHQSERSGH
jgi:hypothetical protein